jgi:Uma2 family endonuclease
MTGVSVLPRSPEWTVEDLRHVPHDGLQYELADGTLLVTPAPNIRHQQVVRNLARILDRSAPPGYELLFAPVDFQPDDRTSLQPDLLVVWSADLEEQRVTSAPLLVVEVLSPSTRSKDLLLKFGLYAQAGVGWYWVVDPERPSVVVFELVEGEFVQRHEACEEPLDLTTPVTVTIVPSEL